MNPLQKHFIAEIGKGENPAFVGLGQQLQGGRNRTDTLGRKQTDQRADLGNDPTEEWRRTEGN